MRTSIVVPHQMQDSPGVAFVKQLLDKVDTSRLSEFKFRFVTDRPGVVSIYGNCKPPRLFSKTVRTRHYRISCSISGKPSDFPKSEQRRFKGKYGRTLRPESRFDFDTLLVWVSAHELYHYLSGAGVYEMLIPDGDTKYMRRKGSVEGRYIPAWDNEINANDFAETITAAYQAGFTL